MKQVDYALVVEPNINEARRMADDGRVGGTWNSQGGDMGPDGMIGRYDWRVWSGSGFGKRLSNYLSNRDGYSYDVSDFGQVVVVTARYHCVGTAKGVEKTFAIVFHDPNKGNGLVYNTSTRWRTISSVDQASSYISGVMNSLASQAR